MWLLCWRLRQKFEWTVNVTVLAHSASYIFAFYNTLTKSKKCKKHVSLVQINFSLIQDVKHAAKCLVVHLETSTNSSVQHKSVSPSLLHDTYSARFWLCARASASSYNQSTSTECHGDWCIYVQNLPFWVLVPGKLTHLPTVMDLLWLLMYAPDRNG